MTTWLIWTEEFEATNNFFILPMDIQYECCTVYKRQSRNNVNSSFKAPQHQPQRSQLC